MLGTVLGAEDPNLQPWSLDSNGETETVNKVISHGDK